MECSKNDQEELVSPSVRLSSKLISLTILKGLIPVELRTEIPISPEPRVDSVEEKSTFENINEILSHSKGLKSTEIEVKHVYEVYDEIAVHWHHTRGKRKVCLSQLVLICQVYWHRVKMFLESLPRGSLVAGVVRIHLFLTFW